MALKEAGVMDLKHQFGSANAKLIKHLIYFLQGKSNGFFKGCRALKNKAEIMKCGASQRQGRRLLFELEAEHPGG